MRRTPSTEQVEHPDASATADADTSASAVVPNAGATVTRTPAEWAEANFPSSDRGRMHPDRWKHAAASQLHGWAAYEARTGKQVQLTAEQYQSAVAAVSGNEFTAHQAADYRTRS